MYNSNSSPKIENDYLLNIMVRAKNWNIKKKEIEIKEEKGKERENTEGKRYIIWR